MTDIQSCKHPECLEIARFKLVVSIPGIPANTTTLCSQHLNEDLYAVGLIANEKVQENIHFQLLIFPLS